MSHVLMKLEGLPDANTPEERRDRLVDAAELIAGEIAEYLSLEVDEVAILALSSDRESLRFLAPRGLYNSGSTFPVSTGSVAGSVIVYKKPSIENDMSHVKNLHFFERIKTGERKPLPIQKMVSVPVVHGKDVLGIVQVCRKGATLQDAGGDFVAQDIQAMQDLVTILGSVIHRDWSEED